MKLFIGLFLCFALSNPALAQTTVKSEQDVRTRVENAISNADALGLSDKDKMAWGRYAYQEAKKEKDQYNRSHSSSSLGPSFYIFLILFFGYFIIKLFGHKETTSHEPYQQSETAKRIELYGETYNKILKSKSRGDKELQATLEALVLNGKPANYIVLATIYKTGWVPYDLVGSNSGKLVVPNNELFEHYLFAMVEDCFIPVFNNEELQAVKKFYVVVRDTAAKDFDLSFLAHDLRTSRFMEQYLEYCAVKKEANAAANARSRYQYRKNKVDANVMNKHLPRHIIELAKFHMAGICVEKDLVYSNLLVTKALGISDLLPEKERLGFIETCKSMQKEIVDSLNAIHSSCS